MAFNLFSFTTKQSSNLVLRNYILQKTSTTLNQYRNNYLSCVLYSSSIESSNEISHQNPEVQKYFNFIQNNLSVLKKTLQTKDDYLEKMFTLLNNKKNLEKELSSLDSMADDDSKDLKQLIQEEKNSLKIQFSKIIFEFFDVILSLTEENDDRNVEIQIIPGIGGLEAKLFSEELFLMYANYASYKNWEILKFSNVSQSTEATSFRMLIKGSNVYNYMKHEGGIHRVQRVPETERLGRVHTSTCSVIVLPQPKTHEIVIKPQDVIVYKTTSSGPGGQNVNKKESCIRLKHIATGISIECQESRFQYQNKSIAFDRLRGILYNMELEKIKTEMQKSKQEQKGTMDYSDKIRTYNFTQNRITDHRIGFSLFNMKSFLLGGKCLDEMISHLRDNDQKIILLEHIRKVLSSAEFKDFEKKQVSN